MNSLLSAELSCLALAYDMPEPVKDYRILTPDRTWRLDLAWPDQKIGVVIETTDSIGDQRLVDAANSCWRSNDLGLTGWIVIRASKLNDSQIETWARAAFAQRRPIKHAV